MNVRSATPRDCPVIREVARQSFLASYSLSPDQIDALVDDVFSDEAVTARIEGSGTFVLVAEDDEESDVLGFAHLEISEDAGTLRWLHVHPAARGRGIGRSLVEDVRERVTERGISLTARVLQTAGDGGEFLEQFGLRQTGTEQVEFAGERYFEQVFTASGDEDDAANEPAVDVPERLTVDGHELVVDRDEPIPGIEAPFFPLHGDEADDQPYGYFCSQCGETDVSADGLDRLACGSCGNEHLADEWDAAYL